MSMELSPGAKELEREVEWLQMLVCALRANERRRDERSRSRYHAARKRRPGRNRY